MIVRLLSGDACGAAPLVTQLYFSCWPVYFPRGLKARPIPRKRNSENEDPRKVKRFCEQPPGSQAMLSAESTAGVAGAAEDWEAAEAPPGGTEVMGILNPGQARIKRRCRAKPLEGKVRKISRNWKKA